MRPFVVHHVGARHGNFPFPAPVGLREDFATVLYDADTDCVDGVADLLGAGHHILPYCLSDADGEAEFKITANASGSSLLEPSEDVRGFRQSLWGVDWDLAEGSRVEERRMLRTRTLDGVLAEGLAPAPDVLCLDTQGSELAILQGAASCLTRDVVCVVSEVQFIDLYEKVPRFGDVSAYLESKGFRFVRFTDLISAEAVAGPIGRRTQGFVVAGDALFLRRLDAFDDRPAAERADRLERLAFSALVFGHVEYAMAALRARGSALDPDQGPAWRRFVLEIEAASAAEAEIALPLFPDILKEGTMAAFRREADPANWPAYFDMARWAQQAGGAEHAQAILTASFGQQDHPLEALLRDHGLPAVADEVNFRRRDQSWKLALLMKQAGLWQGEPGA